jgi:hypothetical protein
MYDRLDRLGLTGITSGRQAPELRRRSPTAGGRIAAGWRCSWLRGRDRQLTPQEQQTAREAAGFSPTPSGPAAGRDRTGRNADLEGRVPGWRRVQVDAAICATGFLTQAYTRSRRTRRARRTIREVDLSHERHRGTPRSSAVVRGDVREQKRDRYAEILREQATRPYPQVAADEIGGF